LHGKEFKPKSAGNEKAKQLIEMMEGAFHKLLQV